VHSQFQSPQRFRDWAAEQTNYPREVAEMALAHTVGNTVEGAYRRGDLLEKRRQLMEEWARYCATPAAAGKLCGSHAHSTFAMESHLDPFAGRGRARGFLEQCLAGRGGAGRASL
jgi:hypothetical protein